MSPLLYLTCTGCLFFGVCAIFSLLGNTAAQATTQRVEQVLKTAPPPAAARMTKESFDRLVAQIAFWVRSHFGLSERGGLGERIAQAGFRGPLPLDIYTASRIVGPLTSILVGALIPYARVFWMIALPAVFYLIPDFLLSYLIRRRRNIIRKGVPDMLDLLVICVDAGLGLDQAMLRVAEELDISHPAIHEELMQINREQRAGKPRMDAWTAMLDRVKLAEIDAFVNMLLQTERFGTPIARALSNFAGNVRQQRTQRVEEAAAKTTIKIIFPLVIFIFPCIFIVLLGPAALSIMHGLKSGF